MKKNLILLYALLSLSLSAQSTMKEDLSKLFLDLDLDLAPKLMIANSLLQFEWGANRGLMWTNDCKTESNDTHTFITKFGKHPFIESTFKKGILTVTQTTEEMETDVFSIHENFEFDNPDDMINEYNRLLPVFEKFGYRVKNSIVQNENFETKFENTEILIGSEQKKAELTISYSMPPKKGKNKSYHLIILYVNQVKD
ncbi:hypothetical protein GCM10023210_13890 [Chryseobacterium ginsengisoli]|uniref:Uncharacterized protein n=1 Tax=Chryseobacterium ginsengisoli TaxID=363853 RepID=A0ABP9M6J5_9FLAO